MWPFKSHEERLIEKAENLPSMLIETAFSISPMFFSALDKKNISVEQTNALYLEFLALTLHIADRLIFSAIGASDCSLLMDHVILMADSELKMKGTPCISDLYNERNSYYSNFTNLGPNNDGSPTGTLLFEFAQLISSRYGNNNSTMELTKLSSAGAQLYNIVKAGLNLEKIL